MPRLFDGVADYFISPVKPISASFNPNTGIDNLAGAGQAFTWAAWVKSAKADGAGDNTIYVLAAKDPLASYTIKIGLKSVAGPQYRLFATIANATTPALALSSDNVVDGWNHLAVVYSGLILTLYMNGVEDAYGTHTTGLGAVVDDSAGAWYIGSDATTFFKGEIGDIRLYAQAFTQSQVVSTMQLGQPASLRAGWKLDGKGFGLKNEPDTRGYNNLVSVGAPARGSLFIPNYAGSTSNRVDEWL